LNAAGLQIASGATILGARFALRPDSNEPPTTLSGPPCADAASPPRAGPRARPDPCLNHRG